MQRVFVVINQGEPVYASKDRDEAEVYAEERWDQALKETAADLDIDLDDPDKLNDIAWQAGSDGGTFDVVPVNMGKYKEDDVITVHIQNGGDVEIEYNDICALFK